MKKLILFFALLGSAFADQAPVLADTSTGALKRPTNFFSGSATGNFVSSITGTANQITASASTGAVTISLPSSIIIGSGFTDTGIATQFTGSVNGYYQHVIQNTNSGTGASADVVVSNNLGTATTYFGDLGINSSTFTGTGNFSLPNATYLYSQNGDLSLGTYTSNAIHFIVNNGATDAGTISTAGAWSLNSLSSFSGQNLTLGTGTFGTALTFTSATGAATFASTLSVNGTGTSSFAGLVSGVTATFDTSGQTNSQFRVKSTANGGMFSIDAYATNNVFAGFDADYVSPGFIARDTTAALIWKKTGYLAIYGDGSLTSGNQYTPTERVRVDLTTGNTNFLSTTSGTSTTAAAVLAKSLGLTENFNGGGVILSSGPTSGIGYATGAGGTVTQATSRTTGVTLNKVSGAITLVSAAGTASWQTFTVTDSAVAATDTISINQKSGTDKYMIHVTAVAAGSFNVTFATTGGTTTEQPVFQFNVIKGSNS